MISRIRSNVICLRFAFSSRYDIHIATLGKKHIAFMKGKETEAIGAYLLYKRISVINSHKLSQIESELGLKTRSW